MLLAKRDFFDYRPAPFVHPNIEECALKLYTRKYLENGKVDDAPFKKELAILRCFRATADVQKAAKDAEDAADKAATAATAATTATAAKAEAEAAAKAANAAEAADAAAASVAKTATDAAKAAKAAKVAEAAVKTAKAAKAATNAVMVANEAKAEEADAAAAAAAAKAATDAAKTKGGNASALLSSAHLFAPKLLTLNRDFQYLLISPVGKQITSSNLTADPEVAVGIVTAIEVLHTICIHRDLRAANILLLAGNRY